MAEPDDDTRRPWERILFAMWPSVVVLAAVAYGLYLAARIYIDNQ